jgi:protein phosphatase
VESHWIPVEHGDAIVLCSDGLYDMCSDREILQVFKNDVHSKDIASQTVEMALKNGGEDNVTSMIVSF